METPTQAEKHFTKPLQLSSTFPEANSSPGITLYKAKHLGQKQPTPPKPKADTILRDKLKGRNLTSEMLIILAGKLIIGSSKGIGNEKPVHLVTIGYDFAVSKYPVTFAEYDAFCTVTKRDKPSDNGWGRDKHPVINITWQDAKDYCQWISDQTDQHYRLPSEAEWEYTCRAGTTTRYSFGNDEKHLSDHAWYDKNSDGKTHPVGEKRPNPWGLHDMHGNIWEWCEDVWHTNYIGAPTDGSAWTTGGMKNCRVWRGGAWNNDPSCLWSASRNWGNLDSRYYSVGMRIAVVF